MKPFIVADSAFPLSPTCMKCYEVGQPVYGRSFNYNLIHTRRVVEQPFGQLKGCWKIMDVKCMLRDPVLVRQVEAVRCALHIICERHQCSFEPGWLPDETRYINLTKFTSVCCDWISSQFARGPGTIHPSHLTSSTVIN